MSKMIDAVAVALKEGKSVRIPNAYKGYTLKLDVYDGSLYCFLDKHIDRARILSVFCVGYREGESVHISAEKDSRVLTDLWNLFAEYFNLNVHLSYRGNVYIDDKKVEEAFPSDEEFVYKRSYRWRKK